MQIQTQAEYDEFDFKKKINKIAAKVEKQSYKKLAFLMLGGAALVFSGYTGSNIILENNKREHAVKEQQHQLLVQNIKQMDEREFINMLDYIAANVEVYDAKVDYIQKVIVKADKEETNTMDTVHASSLGKDLIKYKTKVKEDVSSLLKIRNSVAHDIKVEQEDIDMFFKYMGIYKSKIPMSFPEIDKDIHSIVFNNSSGNMRYNDKHNVSEKVKEFDAMIKSFEFIGNNRTLSKPKM